MTLRHRRIITAAVLMGVVAVGLTFVVAPSANAGVCDNEENILSGGDDFAVDIGPGVVLVGLDKGDTKQDEPEPGGAHVHVCASSDAAGVELRGDVDRGDLPTIENNGSCGVDVLGGGCEIPGFRVEGGDSDSNGTVRLHRSGLPAGDGSTSKSIPETCVIAVGGNC